MSSISVIIPTLNEAQYIGPLLESLQNQTKAALEIIVVDAHSKDNTVQIVSKFKKTKLFYSKPSVALQRNIGAQKASGKLLVFLDADTTIPRQFLQKVDQYFSKNPTQLGCPWFIPMSYNPLILGIYLFFNSMFWLLQKIVPSGASTCLIIKKNVFITSAGFSLNYKFEDIELIRRLSRDHSYRILPFWIKVSPRRFYKQGILYTVIQYLVLSFLFSTNQFKLANKVPYFFGNYKDD
jgi:glycosyltransferase involved in cell wall biosynthesis